MGHRKIKTEDVMRTWSTEVSGTPKDKETRCNENMVDGSEWTPKDKKTEDVMRTWSTEVSGHRKIKRQKM